MKMNFEWAIKMLKEGRKVRRPCWELGSYWVLGVDESIRWTDGTPAHIHISQIDATDWEIYEEEKFDKIINLSNFVEDLVAILDKHKIKVKDLVGLEIKMEMGETPFMLINPTYKTEGGKNV